VYFDLSLEDVDVFLARVLDQVAKLFEAASEVVDNYRNQPFVEEFGGGIHVEIVLRLDGSTLTGACNASPSMQRRRLRRGFGCTE